VPTCSELGRKLNQSWLFRVGCSRFQFERLLLRSSFYLLLLQTCSKLSRNQMSLGYFEWNVADFNSKDCWLVQTCSKLGRTWGRMQSFVEKQNVEIETGYYSPSCLLSILYFYQTFKLLVLLQRTKKPQWTIMVRIFVFTIFSPPVMRSLPSKTLISATQLQDINLGCTCIVMHCCYNKFSWIIFQKAQSHISMVFDLVSYDF